jgi:fucose 4-O-acetylase-like acetyltransferase
MRNKHVDIMLAFGIIFVVMGHRFQPEPFFYPVYFFHMAFFFFISGYLAKVKLGFKNKLLFISAKSKNQLFRYYKYNLLFAIITLLFAGVGIKMGQSVPAFGSEAEILQTLKGFFIQPFTDGHQYHLFLAAWFILQLYIVHIVFQFICYIPNKKLIYTVFIILIPITLFLLQEGLEGYLDFRLTGIRTSYSLLFYMAGYIVKIEEEKIKKILLSPITFVICFIIVDIIMKNFGQRTTNIVIGDIGNTRVYIPIITTALMIMMLYQITHYVAKFIKDNSYIEKIGQSTYNIMIWHFTIFLGINLIFYSLGLITKENLSDNWKFTYKENFTWLIYETLAICIPVYLTFLFRKHKPTNHEPHEPTDIKSSNLPNHLSTHKEE